MRILVTGVLGFIASHFVKHVLQADRSVQVVGFGRNSDQDSHKRLSMIPFLHRDRLKLVYGDLADPFAMSGLCEGIDVVVNFAAKTFVDHCYSADTEVLTKRGWVAWPDAKDSDQFATLGDNFEFQWQMPTEMQAFDYKGEMINFVSKSLDLLVTPNHRMLGSVQHDARRELGPVGFLTAEKVAEMKPHSRGLPFRIPAWSYWAGKIPASGNIVTLTLRHDYGIPYRRDDAKVPLEDWVAFYGIFLAEGFTAGSSQTKTSDRQPFLDIEKTPPTSSASYTVGICQSRKSKHWQEISDLLSRLPFGFRYVGNQWVTCDKMLHSNLFQAGNSSTKFVPTWIKNLPPKYLRIFVDWACKGDGTKTLTTRDGINLWRYYTVSKELADDMQEIFQKLGRPASVRKKDNHSGFGTSIYQVLERKSKYTPINSAIRSQYNGKVYCATVPNGTLYVRRSGFPAWCGNSLKDDLPFLQSNVVGAINLMKDARRYDVKRFVQVSCYDEKTRVLTLDGLKSFDQIKVGEEVLSINPVTNEIEARKVRKVIVQDYDGPMIAFKSNRIDLMVTPNHRMLFNLRYERKEALHIEPASLIKDRTSAILPKGNWSAEAEENVIVDGVGPLNAETLFYLCGVFIGDGFISTQIKKQKNITGLNRKEYLVKARNGKGQFSSGRIGSVNEVSCTSWRIFFDVPENDKARNRLEQSLDELGVKWKAHKNKSGEHVYMCSKEWTEFFRQFGRGAANKCIPRWMLEFGKKPLQALLDGIADSDGHYPGEGRLPRISTCSFRLVEGLCELGFKLGLLPRFSERSYSEATLKSGRVIKSTRPNYTVYFRSELIGIGKQNSSEVHYKGKIWCLEVEGNRNLIAERNGTLTFCGNTDEVYGQILTGSYKEDALLNPRNAYAWSKAAADLYAIQLHRTYGFPVIITRTENNFGAMQNRQKVLPTFVRHALADEPLPVYGDGQHVRCWLHVEEHCRAIWHLIQRSYTSVIDEHSMQGDCLLGEIFHIAGEDELTNIDLAKLVLQTLGKPNDRIRFIPDHDIRPGHDRRYALDCSKLRATGFTIKQNVREKLAETVLWYASEREWTR